MFAMCRLCWVKDALLETMRGVREVVVIVFLAICSMANAIKPCPRGTVVRDEVSYCLSWRMSVEANNMAGWRTVPMQCLPYIQGYMIGGQYDRDMAFIADQILSYVKGIVLSDDGMDAWILDVDDTCISNLFYYKGKRFGCDPYDPKGFKAWALKGGCPAISAVLGLFDKLVESGFKVILLTGRDEETLGQVTVDNLHNQGFIGYERLILRYVITTQK
ncbi:Acid phosphatase 1 [Vitis vinifera]|uniref:Acid phosphatase 1 n=1 Tax=Vitis vinifera TaxID=29760 RepID=A0A438H8D5_VITVI|nr:Acid phosphatase 1 [Vitis vinifera]